MLLLSSVGIPGAAETLADAFTGSEIMEYLFPDESRRYRDVKTLFSFLTRYGVENGEVWVTGNTEGVAVWFPPSDSSMSPLRMIKAGAIKTGFSIPFTSLVRTLRFSSFTNSLKKKSFKEEGWYLASLGVRKESQGKGFGSSLVQYFLKNRAGAYHAYLETTTDKNIWFYKRLGFIETETGKLGEPGINITEMAHRPIHKETV
ncbi:MAG: GNAT family N-acetyltransferase [Chitinivibrionales bacterium]